MSADTDSLDNPGSNEAPYAKRTIALVGLMGAGKSTVGRRLASKLGREFYDSDIEIEKAAGLSIADIFSIHGEAEFRRGERKVLARLLDGKPHVLATGGGAYLDPETRAVLREKAITVWLNADLETIWKRVSRRDTRPLLRAPDPKGVLTKLFQEREPIYSQADLSVTSVDGPHSETVKAIIIALEGWTGNG
ncbi:MAG: shikimate kinase [Pseudomonadota bacterium]